MCNKQLKCYIPFTTHIQSTPEFVPEQCTPAFDKVDIPRLMGDMPKWKQWIADTSQEEWDDFFHSKLPTLMGVSEHPCPWQSLVAAVQQTVGSNAQPDLGQNQQLVDLFEAEDIQPNVS